MTYDVAIIGAGPGGYTAAIRAAQLGFRTCLVEEREVGGTCLNEGCIPTKFLLAASKKYSDMMDSEAFGIVVQDCTVDMDKMLAGKESVVGRLVKGVQYLVKKNNIDFKSGRAEITGKNEIRIRGGSEIISVSAAHIVIATGTVPAMPALFKHDGSLVCSSSEALRWRDIPDRLTIIGGGVIGCEFATIYSNLGSRVTVIELLPGILSAFDPELSKIAAAALKKNGVEIIAGVKVDSIEKSGSGVAALLQDGKMIDADRLLVSIGRKPNTSGIGLDTAGVKINEASKKIAVNEYMQTSVENIYAIGDVCDSPLDLAHVAMREGLAAIANISGERTAMEYHCIPNCVFTNPEIATVGLTQEKAENGGREVRTGRFGFSANGKALSIREAEGFVKIVIDKKTDAIIGAQIAGPHATDLIAELAVLVNCGCRGTQLANTVHAHPTLAEAVWEAVENAYGKAIHC